MSSILRERDGEPRVVERHRGVLVVLANEEVLPSCTGLHLALLGGLDERGPLGADSLPDGIREQLGERERRVPLLVDLLHNAELDAVERGTMARVELPG